MIRKFVKAHDKASRKAKEGRIAAETQVEALRWRLATLKKEMDDLYENVLNLRTGGLKTLRKSSFDFDYDIFPRQIDPFLMKLWKVRASV